MQSFQFSSVQLLGCVRLFVTPLTAVRPVLQASLSITNSRSLLKLMSIESVMSSNHLTRCLPLLLLPSIFPSIRVFSKESVLWIMYPKYWSFSFSISPFSDYSGLISFRMDWLDLLAVQGTLKSLLQHHSSEASTFHRSAFFHVKWLHLKYWIPKILKCWWIHVKGSHLFFAKQDSNSSTSEVIMCRWVELKKWYSFGEGNGNPLQCSCLENPRDEGAWGSAVYGVTQSRTRLKRLSSSSSRSKYKKKSAKIWLQ